MKRTETMPSHSGRGAAEAVTIRMGVPADAAALSRLAQLDSAPAPVLGAVLLAEVDGELCAALPLDGGHAFADPFRRTAELVAMLAERARQLERRPVRRTVRRWWPVSAASPAPVPRA
jgi:hypothetical protein